MSTQNTTPISSDKAAGLPKTRHDAHKYLRIELSDGTVKALHRLLHRVAEHLGVGRVGLSLFDDRRAHYRLTEGFDTGSSEREEVICNRVFSRNESIVCADVLNSPDLAGYPVVEKENVRFYTGVPLHDEDGAPIGTICGWEQTPLEVPTPETLRKVEEFALLASTLIQGEVRYVLSEKERQYWQSQALLEQQLLDTKGDLAVLIGQDLRIIYATPLFLNMLRRRSNELTGLRIESFLEGSTPIDFQTSIAQVSVGEPLETTVRLRSKGTKSSIKRMRLHKSHHNGDLSQAPHYVVVFTDDEKFSSLRSPAQFRRQLIQASRNSLSGQDRLDKIVSLVNSRVRGSDNVTIVSMVTGPQTRKILHQQKDAQFISDLGQHHDFDPDVSICASTAANNRYLFCADSLLEDRWPDYEWLFYAHDVRSVWCMPVPSDEGLPSGLLTVFRKEAGAPDAADLETLEECAEWVSTLLLGDNDLPESPSPPTTTLQTLEKQVHKALTNAESHDHCFLVALNAGKLLEEGATERQIVELINLHFEHPQKVFKMRHDVWCWIAPTYDRFTVLGAMEKLNTAAVYLHHLNEAAQPKLCAYVPVEASGSVTAAIASLGRQIQHIGQTRSLAV